MSSPIGHTCSFGNFAPQIPRLASGEPTQDFADIQSTRMLPQTSPSYMPGLRARETFASNKVVMFEVALINEVNDFNLIIKKIVKPHT